MYNSKILIEMISKAFKKKKENKPKNSLFLTQKILDKIEIKSPSRKQSAFVIKIENYNDVNNSINNNNQNKKIKVFYNDMNFKDIKELITENATPIEKKIFTYNQRHFGKKYSKIFDIKINKDIFHKKLKPTPFENSRNKSNNFRNNVLLKQFLYKNNNLSNYVIKPFKTIQPLITDKNSFSQSRCDTNESYRNLTTRNFYTNRSNINNNNNSDILNNINKRKIKKSKKKIYFLRPQCYFNLNNIKKIQNNIKSKRLIDI